MQAVASKGSFKEHSDWRFPCELHVCEASTLTRTGFALARGHQKRRLFSITSDGLGVFPLFMA